MAPLGLLLLSIRIGWHSSPTQVCGWLTHAIAAPLAQAVTSSSAYPFDRMEESSLLLIFIMFWINITNSLAPPRVQMPEHVAVCLCSCNFCFCAAIDGMQDIPIIAVCHAIHSRPAAQRRSALLDSISFSVFWFSGGQTVVSHYYFHRLPKCKTRNRIETCVNLTSLHNFNQIILFYYHD